MVERIKFLLRYAGQGLLDLLFPAVCPHCRQVVTTFEEPICEDCLASLPRTDHAYKRQNEVEELFLKYNERYKQPKFILGGAFCYYGKNNFRDLVHSAKFFHRPQINSQLAAMLAQEYAPYGFFDDIDMIFPIPLHPKRLKERGYNQTLYIAEGIHQVTQIPIATQYLYRTINNPKQSQQNYEERGKNVEGIFAVHFPEQLKNKHILLLDDVITSGSTIDSALQVLFPIRDCKVSVLALACAHTS